MHTDLYLNHRNGRYEAAPPPRKRSGSGRFLLFAGAILLVGLMLGGKMQIAGTAKEPAPLVATTPLTLDDVVGLMPDQIRAFYGHACATQDNGKPGSSTDINCAQDASYTFCTDAADPAHNARAGMRSADADSRAYCLKFWRIVIR